MLFHFFLVTKLSSASRRSKRTCDEPKAHCNVLSTSAPSHKQSPHRLGSSIETQNLLRNKQQTKVVNNYSHLIAMKNKYNRDKFFNRLLKLHCSKILLKSKSTMRFSSNSQTMENNFFYLKCKIPGP